MPWALHPSRAPRFNSAGEGRRLALAEETFVGLCQSVTESLGLTATPTAA